MEKLLRMSGISKVYSNGVYANKNISFEVIKGEIHALMGENGAGKSTLMKILFGLELADEGSIFYKDKLEKISDPSKAIGLGIGMVNQHFMLIDELTVYENVILGMEPKKGILIDIEKSKNLVKEYAKKFNLGIDPMETVGDLSVSKKQKVELLKVLVRGSDLIILDEPTAVLTPQETEELFQQLILLKDEGYTIIFITHKINEVLQICDNITVLRKGRAIGTIKVKDSTAEDISRMMVGRDVLLQFDKRKKSKGEVLLEINKLSIHNHEGKKIVDNLNLSIRENEIVGIAGVEGNGQKELADAIFGLTKGTSGELEFKGKKLSQLSVKQRRNIGLGYIPEDRIKMGSAVDRPIWENLIADKLDESYCGSNGLLNMKKINDDVSLLIGKYNIVSIDHEQEMGMLSGGNMQKVVVARELSSQPTLLIANQPTRGIDVGAQEFIWNELIRFCDNNKSIILISADLNELLSLSDRIIVMYRGRIVADITNTESLNEGELGYYMLGVKEQKLECDKYEG